MTHIPQREISHSGDICRLTGISPRQLQWWAEKRLIRARIQGKVRHFDREQVARAWLIADLRRRNLPLQRVRKVMKSIATWCSSILNAMETHRYLVTDVDGNCALIAESQTEVVQYLCECSTPMILIELQPKNGELVN